MDKMDRRLDGISKLMLQGMRMLSKTDTTLAELAQAQKSTDMRVRELAQAQKATNQSLAELAQAQKATERRLRAFIDSLRQGRNGRNNR